MLYPSGNIYYSQESSPAFVSFTTNTTNVNEKRGGNATVKREGEKVLLQPSTVSRQLHYGLGPVSDHNSEKGRSTLPIAKMIEGSIIYGTATAVGVDEGKDDVWTIKLDNSDEDEKEPVSKIDLEPLVQLYTESIPNNSQDNRKVCDGGKLSDNLSDFYKPIREDKRSRKQTEFLLSPTKKDDDTDNITPPDPEDATTCTMFFHDNDRYLLELLVDTVETEASASQPTTLKLILVPEEDIGCYLNFYESYMPQTTQCKSRLDKKV